MLSCKETREETLFILKNLLLEIDLNTDGCETICTDYLEILLLKLVRANSFSLRPATSEQTSKECACAKRYMDENYAKDITLDQLADMAHVNKFYLIRTFKKEFNMSPITYLIQRRLLESKYLLRNTDHSLEQISHLVGFSSSSYFSQSFRNQENISPTEYRRRQRAQNNG